MVGLKKLKVYKITNEDLFNDLRSNLSGYCFFRKDETGFYIKAPKMDLVESMVNSGLFIEMKNPSL